MAILRVGITNIPGTRRKCRYSDVYFDRKGWANAILYLPSPFELMWLKTNKGTKPGWWTGSYWDGLNFTEDLKVLFWKRKPEVV